MQIYRGAVQTEQIYKSYSVNKNTQYELSRIEHALTIPTSFSSHKILNIYKLNILSVAVSMYQIRIKTVPLTFSGSFEKICHGYPTNFSQFNYKIPNTTLRKGNSESHLEGLPSGITFSKILKRKLNHFRSLNINRNWNCYLLAMNFHAFKIFQPWVHNILLTKRDLMTKPKLLSASPSSFQKPI